MMNRVRLTLPALTLLTGALLLSACGSSAGPTTAARTTTSSQTSMGMGSTPSASSMQTNNEHNNQDTTFAQLMIVHHRGAVEMAKLAATNAQSAEVKTLARKIEGAQQPEIATMSSWLTAWGAMVPQGLSQKGIGMDGMDMGGGASMPGMMSDSQMAQLGKAAGASFDKLFLQMMIEHHQGAIIMAKDEQTQGKNTAAMALAEKIVRDQTAEIADMTKMLGSR